MENMDLLDCLDLETAPKKCHRVRSWYLYEQFKSLERNQLDAARRLKSKSCQDKILHQELHERRVRRRLCDEFGSDHNQSRFEMGEESSKIACASVDNLFESLCELETENEFFDSDTCTPGEFSEKKKKIEFESKGVEENNLGIVISNNRENEGASNNLKEELDLLHTNIAENINLQLEMVTENIECLEKYAKLCDDGTISDLESYDSLERSLKDSRNDKFMVHYENSTLLMWSKLVTFAYQIIELNHGANCYFDYSSQFLTAVLAFDVLRRVVGGACDILQPYVSPIGFNSSEVKLTNSCIYCQKKENWRSNTVEFKCDNRKKQKNSSENDWQYKYQNLQNKLRRERGHHIEKLSFKNLSQDYTIPNMNHRTKFTCKCQCLRKVFVRLLQLSQLVEDIIDEVTD